MGDRQYLIFSKILFHPSFFDLIYIRLILNKEWKKNIQYFMFKTVSSFQFKFFFFNRFIT